MSVSVVPVVVGKNVSNTEDEYAMEEWQEIIKRRKSKNSICSCFASLKNINIIINQIQQNEVEYADLFDYNLTTTQVAKLASALQSNEINKLNLVNYS